MGRWNATSGRVSKRWKDAGSSVRGAPVLPFVFLVAIDCFDGCFDRKDPKDTKFTDIGNPDRSDLVLRRVGVNDIEPTLQCRVASMRRTCKTNRKFSASSLGYFKARTFAFLAVN